MSSGRLMTTPIAPSALCSIISTMVLKKLSSFKCFVEIRKCPFNESNMAQTPHLYALQIALNDLKITCDTGLVNKAGSEHRECTQTDLNAVAIPPAPQSAAGTRKPRCWRASFQMRPDCR